MGMLITVATDAAESKYRTALPRLKIVLIRCRSRAVAKESVQVVHFLALLTAATPCPLSLLGLQGAARKTLPTFRYVAYNRN